MQQGCRLCSRPQLLETTAGSLPLFAGYPGFHKYRALGSLECFLEYSLKKRKIKAFQKTFTGKISAKWPPKVHIDDINQCLQN